MSDLIIPLGAGSKFDDDELRLCLRSAELHAVDLGRVVIVTQKPPCWLTNAVVVSCADTLKHNKDGNMINKVLTAITELNIHGDFICSCDDMCFMKDVVLDSLPIIYNSRGKHNFDANGNRWHKRMIRTFDFLEDNYGIELKHNYDSHVPQRFNADAILENITGIDYESGIGYCIFTLFRGICKETGGELQDNFKTVHESMESANSVMDKMFVGYNDNAFSHGLRERLFEIFNKKSKYEK